MPRFVDHMRNIVRNSSHMDTGAEMIAQAQVSHDTEAMSGLREQREVILFVCILKQFK
jgi:hypothetical protein